MSEPEQKVNAAFEDYCRHMLAAIIHYRRSSGWSDKQQVAEFKSLVKDTTQVPDLLSQP